VSRIVKAAIAFAVVAAGCFVGAAACIVVPGQIAGAWYFGALGVVCSVLVGMVLSGWPRSVE
jgi:hypothetical protein